MGAPSNGPGPAQEHQWARAGAGAPKWENQWARAGAGAPKMGEPLSQSQRRSTKMGEPLRPPHTRGPAQVFQSLNRQHPLQHPLFGGIWYGAIKGEFCAWELAPCGPWPPAWPRTAQTMSNAPPSARTAVFHMTQKWPPKKHQSARLPEE